MTSLEDRIDDIVNGEWWKDDSREDYLHAAKELMKLGMTENQAVAFVAKLYYAAAAEYGS
jgi:hypothetical protein